MTLASSNQPFAWPQLILLRHKDDEPVKQFTKSIIKSMFLAPQTKHLAVKQAPLPETKYQRPPLFRLLEPDTLGSPRVSQNEASFPVGLPSKEHNTRSPTQRHQRRVLRMARNIPPKEKSRQHGQRELPTVRPVEGLPAFPKTRPY